MFWIPLSRGVFRNTFVLFSVQKQRVWWRKRIVPCIYSHISRINRTSLQYASRQNEMMSQLTQSRLTPNVFNRSFSKRACVIKFIANKTNQNIQSINIWQIDIIDATNFPPIHLTVFLLRSVQSRPRFRAWLTVNWCTCIIYNYRSQK